jgi:ABC-type uncharacterized transport system substrate-binding protein
VELDLELIVRISHSDQETLFFFRRMVRDIEGFWLFPDNRILSARVLKQMLDEANQQHVPVTVPNESMLAMGAAISISTVASDIAETIVNIVRRIQAGEIDEVLTNYETPRHHQRAFLQVLATQADSK